MQACVLLKYSVNFFSESCEALDPAKTAGDRALPKIPGSRIPLLRRPRQIQLIAIGQESIHSILGISLTSSDCQPTSAFFEWVNLSCMSYLA